LSPGRATPYRPAARFAETLSMRYPPVTLAIVALTCIVSFAAFKNMRLLDRLLLWPPGIRRHHQYDRFLTCGFVHADFGHLLFNMFTLFSFGATMERIFAPAIGEAGFAMFYAAAVVVSALPSYWRHRNDPNYRSLGASGAVSAVLFAYILLRPWSTILIFAFPVPAIVFAIIYLGYTIYMDRVQRDRINHSAHLWGAIFGVLFTIALDPGVLPRFFEQLVHPRFGAGF
jgi:membrane associated rhomboid family serine protease